MSKNNKKEIIKFFDDVCAKIDLHALLLDVVKHIYGVDLYTANKPYIISYTSYSRQLSMKTQSRFCDFCDCANCKDGAEWLSNASTSDGRRICDVCYVYDLCTSNNNPFGAKRNPDGPCTNKDCEHRPKIIGEWAEYENNESK